MASSGWRFFSVFHLRVVNHHNRSTVTPDYALGFLAFIHKELVCTLSHPERSGPAFFRAAFWRTGPGSRRIAAGFQIIIKKGETDLAPPLSFS
jgi:hypothetical protein